MKTFSANLITALEKENATAFILVEMQFSAPLRYTNAEVDFYFSGDLYTPEDIRFDRVAYSASGAVDAMTLSIGNVDLSQSAIVLGQNVTGKTVILTIVVLDPADFSVIGSFEPFRGLVNTWDLDEDRVNYYLVNELILWRKKTLRTASSSCPWPFKSTECGYAGEESWCDQTYDRCAALTNSDQFGGNRFLPSIMEKDIWWGRVPG